MKKNNVLRKFLSVMLCVCLSMGYLPAYAFSQSQETLFEKVELTDLEMEKIIGASGSVDVTMSDHTRINDPVQAVLANRTSLYYNYTMEVTRSNGEVLEVIASGQLPSGTAALITGNPTLSDGSYQYVRTRLYTSGVPALEAVDSSAAQNY